MLSRFLYSLTILLFISSCGGGGGGSTPEPTLPAVSVTFSSSANEIYIGQLVTLTWSSSNASSCSASGAWSGSKGLSGNESIRLDTEGGKTFTISCSNTSGDSRSRSVNVNVIGNSEGKVVALRYLNSSTVFIDVNSNYEFDGGEIETTTDENGSFILPDDSVDILSVGGLDNLTNKNLGNLTFAHPASEMPPRILSAITSLDYAHTESVNGSSDINRLLDLDDFIDIYTTDPISVVNTGSNFNKYFEINAQITTLVFALQNYVNTANSLSLNSKTFFDDFAVSVNQFEEVDIESKEFIDSYIQQVFSSNSIDLESNISDLSLTNKADLSNMLHALIQRISIRSDSAITDALNSFAIDNFIDYVNLLASGSLNQDVLESLTSDIDSVIAADQNIDESDLKISISTNDDAFTLDEDTNKTFFPLENDVIETGDDYYGLSVSLSSPDNGSAVLNADNSFTYTPDENYFGSDSLTYTVFVDGSISSSTVFITINSVNDAPEFVDFIPSKVMDENLTNVLTVEVEDIENDSIGYSLSGPDKDYLSISATGAITFKSNPDFELPNDVDADNIYVITVEASDGIDVVKDDLSITILDVDNEGNPIIEGLSSQSFNENQNLSIPFTVTDPQNDEISFELTGVDKDLFNLSFDGSNATLTSSSKDYENPQDSDSNNVYLFNVNFSDDLNTTSQEVEISISNINDNLPVFTSDSTFTVPENQNTAATVTASDADNDTLTFSISGGDSSLMQITSEGVLSFTTSPNFESKNSYYTNVQVQDGKAGDPIINYVSQTVTINISDVNEAPVWNIPSTSFEYQENTFNVETIDVPDDVSDEDGDALSYSLTGEDASAFVIDGNVVRFNGAPDYENPDDSNEDNIYLLNVIASDGFLSTVSPEFRVSILNINDNNPVFIELQEDIEVTNGQSNVINVTVSDADGDDVDLSISGEDSSAFTILDSDTLAFKTSPDFSNPIDSNGDNTYLIFLEASDGERITTSNQISITVLEVNNPPIINDLQTSYSIDENNVEVASFTVSDPENNQLTIGVSGDDSEGFSISNNVLSYEGGFNFESPTDANSDNTYNITVFADDGFNRTTQDVQIIVINVDEGPVFSVGSDINIDENERIVANITVSDPEGDTFTWDTTISGDDGSLFRYFGTNPDTKNLGFNAFEGADFENPQDANSDNVYQVQLRAVEDKTNGIETILNLSITINDLKDTWSISGTLYSNPYTLIDGDVPDIIDYPPVTNNDSSSAQIILNPTDVIGHIGDNTETVVVLGDDGFCLEDPNNLGFCLTEEVQNIDPEDWFKFTGAPNLLLTLSIEGLIFEQDGSFYCCTTDDLDADLLIYNEDGSLASFTYTSNSTSTYKQIVIPSSGTYYAVVKAVEGHTKYVLTLGSNVTGVSTLLSPENNYALERFISYIPFGPDFNSTNNSNEPLYTDGSLDTKFIKFEESQNKGLSIFNFNLEDEFKSIFNDNYLLDSKNISQVTYLKHWKVLQHYREKYPSLNLELDFKEKALFTNDPNWDYQWGLQQIGLESVLATIGSNVKDIAVAVLDTGSPAVTSTAYATSAFASGGYDFVPAENGGDGDGIDNDPTDSLAGVDSHGTHVATTISALNDGQNINGFGIQTVPIRVLGADGTGYVSDIIQGLLYAGGLSNISGEVYSGDVPIKVINMSLGSVRSSCSNSYQQAINDIYSRGITLVAASGNDAQEYPGSYGYPASCNNVISVGALDVVQQRSYYSTYNDQVDIAAPGGDLTADINADGYRDGILAFETNEDLGFLQGTSMASPHVAGAIAVLYALVPNLQPFQIDGLLADGHLTDDIGDTGKDDEYGFGALNLQKAVNRIIDDEGLDFTYGTIDINSLNFGLDVDSYQFNVNKIGDGELSVSELETNIPSAISINEVNVDSDGFGSYSVSVDRSSLPDGLYQGNIQVTFSNENSASFSVSFQVGADRERIYIPSVYIALYNDDGDFVLGGSLEMTDGVINFIANDVPLDNYYFGFSTTIDRFIFDPAEFLNYYPDASSPYDYFELGEGDIQNGAVTLLVNKSTGGLSTSEKILLREIKISLEDFNATVNGQSSRIFKINE